MFHDKRIHSKKAERSRERRQFMLRGARKINLWQHLPEPKLGSMADDWETTGESIRSAMNQFAATCER